MPFSVGELIDGHYRVEQRFAGGMGFVYVVLDEIVGKRFAIKQLSELHAESEILRERFRREASTWLLLDYHPHIVQAHSYLPRQDAPMLILEYVDGPSLDRMLRVEKRLCAGQTVAYAKQLCRAMQHAHARVIPERGVGVLHRDIKPANLLLSRTNQLKVTDFGLAKISGDPNLTSEGQFVGTVAYSSPEQLRAAGSVTKSSDVYSFGAVMYQMLTGHQPFRGSTAAELYYAVQETEPRPVHELIPEVDPKLASIVRRCLSKYALERFADFNELEHAIEQLDPNPETEYPPCPTCGFLSRRSPTKCSVCGYAVQPSTKRSQKASHRAGTTPCWHCACGQDVPARRAKCPECGASRPTTTLRDNDTTRPWAVSDDPDAPLPVLGLMDSTPECHAEQKSTWAIEPDKEYLVELKPNGMLLPWQLDRSGYTLGRAENMKICIDDPNMARYQLFLVRLPCGWLAINPQAAPPLEANGRVTRQHLLRPGDLLRVGDTWLAYSGPSLSGVTLAPIPGRRSEQSGSDPSTATGNGSTVPPEERSATACHLELSGDRRFTTQGQPLRIGSSPLCDVRLDMPAVAPVHALLAWQPDGPHLINVARGGVRELSGGAVNDRLLHDGDLIQIGDVPIRARVEGDASFPARRAGESDVAAKSFALTVLTGAQRGQTATMLAGQTVSIGRHSGCDVVLASDSFISRRHVEIKAGASDVDLKDLGSRGGFFVNQTHYTTTGVARLGDVIVLGKTSLLLHYPIRFAEAAAQPARMPLLHETD